MQVGCDEPAGQHDIDVAATLQGASTGGRDGNVLVVDAAGYRAHPEGLRFTIYLTTPVTYRTTWDYRSGLAHSNLPCDSASARRFLKST